MDKLKLVEAYRSVFVDIWYDQSMYYTDKQKLIQQIAIRLGKLDQQRLEEDERNAIV